MPAIAIDSKALQASLSSARIRLAARLLRLPLPHSIVGLVLSGFCLVALPLLISVAIAVVYVDRLAQRSEQLVTQGLALTQHSRQLNEQLTDMERLARQYQVLGDNSLFKQYQDQQTLLSSRLDLLAMMVQQTTFDAHRFTAMHQAARTILTLLKHQANTGVTITDDKAPAARALIKNFDTLQNAAQDLVTFSNLRIDRHLNTLLATSNQADLILFWLALAAALLALVGGVMFIVLITEPIYQMRNAIQTLGEGNLTQTITIRGPRELLQVGSRLDWLRRRLLDLEEQKNRFLRHVSHELKTPLASIREGTELLTDGTVGSLSESQAEIADIVRENSIELQLLIENLLSFSAWQQHRRSFRPGYLTLQPVLEELRAKYKLILASKRLRLTAPATRLVLYADHSLLRTALDNLLSNAVKFTPEGGTIRMQASRERRCCRIDVIDSGPGIGPTDRESIFEPFFTRSPAAGKWLRGTGIGLSVARECIQAHNGTIEVVDDNHNGAHFRITLPAPH